MSRTEAHRSGIVGGGEIQQMVAATWARYAGITNLIAVLVLAGIARVRDLDSKSLWLDEAFSVFVARQPLDRMMEIIVGHDTQPPFYYGLLHYWLRMGDDPYTVRLLSALLGTAIVVPVYLLAREVASHRVGLVAGLLVAVSPFLVWYGQEARMYSLLGLLGGFSAYFLLRSLKTGRLSYWVAYIVATSLATYTQASAWLFVMAEGLAALSFLAWTGEGVGLQGERSSAGWRPLLVSNAVVVLLWLPWLPSFLLQSQTYRQFWIDPPSPSLIVTLVLELTSSYLPHWRVPNGLEILLGVAVSLVLLARLRLRGREFSFLLLLFVVPIAALYLVSLSRPIFLSRAIIYVSVPFLVLVASSLAGLRRWKLGAVLLSVLLLLNLVSLYRLYSVTEKEEWDLVAGYVAARATSGELVLFLAADGQIAFDYYGSREPKPLERRGVPVDVLTVGPLEPSVEVGDLARLGQLTAERESFWLVDSHSKYVDPNQTVRALLEERYRPVDRREFEGITVLRYGTKPERPADASRMRSGVRSRW